MFRDLWDAQAAKAAERKKLAQSEIGEIDRKVAVLVDRVVESDSRSVISALETRIDELERRKLILTENLSCSGTPQRSYDESFRTAMAFLASPWNLWKSDRLEAKRAVLKLTFADHLRYSRTSGFRTPKTSLPFNVLGRISTAVEEMVRPERFERPTLRFVV